jgi:hypothetical protein
MFPIVMLGYGFSIAANPFDHFAVGLKVPVGSPLADARAWRADQSLKANKKSKTDGDYRCYIFNAEHPRAQTASWLETSIFSQDLVDSISVLSGNHRELRSERFKSTGTVLDMDARRLTDSSHHRNLLHTLCQLRLECSSRLEILRANAPEFKDDSAVATCQKQEYAKLYRASQLQTLETAVLLCRYCLLRAQSPQGEDRDLVSSAAAAEHIVGTSAAIADVQKLVHRTPSKIDMRTLFTFSDAVELLPAKLAAKARDAAEFFCGELGEKQQLGFSRLLAMNNSIQEKIWFTALLVVLRKAYSEPTVALSTNIKLWMKNLKTWYPFNDSFWNGPTEDFLPILEVLVGVADRAAIEIKEPAMGEDWSDPKMLCWGWNVQEEEGVLFDAAVLESNGDRAAFQPSNYLLCIPCGLESNGAPS